MKKDICFLMHLRDSMNIIKGILYFQMLSAMPFAIFIAVRDLNDLFLGVAIFCLGMNGFILSYEKYHSKQG